MDTGTISTLTYAAGLERRGATAVWPSALSNSERKSESFGFKTNRSLLHDWLILAVCLKVSTMLQPYSLMEFGGHSFLGSGWFRAVHAAFSAYDAAQVYIQCRRPASTPLGSESFSKSPL